MGGVVDAVDCEPSGGGIPAQDAQAAVGHGSAEEKAPLLGDLQHGAQQRANGAPVADHCHPLLTALQNLVKQRQGTG